MGPRSHCERFLEERGFLVRDKLINLSHYEGAQYQEIVLVASAWQPQCVRILFVVRRRSSTGHICEVIYVTQEERFVYLARPSKECCFSLRVGSRVSQVWWRCIKALPHQSITEIWHLRVRKGLTSNYYHDFRLTTWRVMFFICSYCSTSEWWNGTIFFWTLSAGSWVSPPGLLEIDQSVAEICAHFLFGCIAALLLPVWLWQTNTIKYQKYIQIPLWGL